jgi:hypothetical protein
MGEKEVGKKRRGLLTIHKLRDNYAHMHACVRAHEI